MNYNFPQLKVLCDNLDIHDLTVSVKIPEEGGFFNKSCINFDGFFSAVRSEKIFYSVVFQQLLHNFAHAITGRTNKTANIKQRYFVDMMYGDMIYDSFSTRAIVSRIPITFYFTCRDEDNELTRYSEIVRFYIIDDVECEDINLSFENLDLIGLGKCVGYVRTFDAPFVHGALLYFASTYRNYLLASDGYAYRDLLSKVTFSAEKVGKNE
jgi:hypothetical protein